MGEQGQVVAISGKECQAQSGSFVLDLLEATESNVLWVGSVNGWTNA